MVFLSDVYNYLSIHQWLSIYTTYQYMSVYPYMNDKYIFEWLVIKIIVTAYW